jgi:hypothetical protein
MRNGWLTVGWTQLASTATTPTPVWLIGWGLNNLPHPSPQVAEQGARKTRIRFKHFPELDAGKPDAPRWTLRHHLCGSRTGIEQ